MTSVNPFVPDDAAHAPLLMGLVLRGVQQVFAAEDWKGLRTSHFRVISAVPPGGISITELGDRVGMSKQGCGQFVTQLTESGHLRVQRDPGDGRTRIVRRTAHGTRTVRRVTARNLELEREWADQVGPARYRTFRGVLEELAQRVGEQAGQAGRQVGGLAGGRHGAEAGGDDGDVADVGMERA